ncbi:hypothetical protein JTE90_010753 [Oedothorax gibbosus]|nr:hypothetical protein JTE90_010753 [Oedothorax gibbosus]
MDLPEGTVDAQSRCRRRHPLDAPLTAEAIGDRQRSRHPHSRDPYNIEGINGMNNINEMNNINGMNNRMHHGSC